MSEQEGHRDSFSNGLRSRPDPTVLTTEQLLREVQGLKELLETKLEVLDGKMTGHFLIDAQRFAKIDQQFSAIEDQRVEQKRDTQEALIAALCVSADTPVLCADLVWRPAGVLASGDELIAPEEEARATGRRFVRSVVLANSLSEDVLFRVTTEDGTVRCNLSHPWLVRRTRGHAYEWIPTSELRVGDLVSRPVDVWEVERTWEAGWLAGILDGEGSLSFKSRRDGSARLSIGQVAGVTADKIEEALAMRIGVVGRHTRPSMNYGSGGYVGIAQAQKRWQIDGRSDILRLLGSVRPARLLTSATEVWEGRNLRRKGGGSAITALELDGVGTIANLTTSSGTYFAGGFSAHNTAQKEAVGKQDEANQKAIAKSEAATAETLAKLSELFKTTTDGLSGKIDDVKERVHRMESLKQGAVEVRQESHATINAITASIGAIIAAIVLALGVYAAIHASGPATTPTIVTVETPATP